MNGTTGTTPEDEEVTEETCKHENMEITDDAEGDLSEARLTRKFTDYNCPDCEYSAESPPPGWEPDLDIPYNPDY